jgi:predicted nucleic acid-binding protein
MSETVRTMLMKFHYNPEATARHLDFLKTHCDIAIIGVDDYSEALRIFTQYSISWWDSLIVATALRSDCSSLLSEDLQHGLSIEGRLTVVNPFR